MARRLVVCSLNAVALAVTAAAQDPRNFIYKLGAETETGPGTHIVADGIALNTTLQPEVPGGVTGVDVVPQIQFRGGNLQASSPLLDYTQMFTGFRPFIHAIQSEVSATARGNNIVLGYNNSAGVHLTALSSSVLAVDRIQFTGFSTSNDGGKTWTSGYIPNPAGGGATYGDPSVDADRRGVIFYAHLAENSMGHFGIYVNRSTDSGRTWGDAVPVQLDEGADKEWLAVGPDPVKKSQDNIYVTWTSFQSAACELRFGKSTDGGVTFTAKTIFVPTHNTNPTFPQECLQFSNPVVDPIRGTLYVPFLRFSNLEQDFIQMMISDDAGDTFHFATFDVPGAPNPNVYPVTQAGHLTSCGRIATALNLRLTIHGAQNPGPGIGIAACGSGARWSRVPGVAQFDQRD